MDSSSSDRKRLATERMAENLRAELARRRMSGRDLGQRCGWSLGATSRKINGHTPLTGDDLAAIEQAGIPASKLIEGIADAAELAS